MTTLKKAFGGVVVNAAGQVLLKEPTNHFDGYVWTYPKGRPNPGEEPEATALREVWEESGVDARIVARIPGSFAGGTTDNVFFFMEPLEEKHAFDPEETSALRWASCEEAARLIEMTMNDTGRARDRDVLAAAREVLVRREQERGVARRALSVLPAHGA